MNPGDSGWVSCSTKTPQGKTGFWVFELTLDKQNHTAYKIQHKKGAGKNTAPQPSGAGNRRLRRKEGFHMEKEYQIGTFCKDIKCRKHKALEGLSGNAYLRKKNVHCADCEAWKFFNWLKEKKFRIVHSLPQMSSKELAARLRGLDIVRVEDLTEDEIMCL